MTGGTNITSSRASDDKMYPSASINAAAAVAVAAAARHPVSAFISLSRLLIFLFFFSFASFSSYVLTRSIGMTDTTIAIKIKQQRILKY